MIETCPTCGCPVAVVGGEEGTLHFQRVPEPLGAFDAAAEQLLDASPLEHLPETLAKLRTLFEAELG